MKRAFNKGQQGFTLLELLVVITLLAVLSLGALVAYDGIGENAAATAATNNASAADRAIRTYRAVQLSYPNQWDNLSAADTGAGLGILAEATETAYGNFAIGAAGASVSAAIIAAFDEVGIDEVQQLDAADIVAVAQLAPNLQHNEGSNALASEVEFADPAFDHISIVPAGAGCQAGGQAIADDYDGTAPTLLAASSRLNKINDSLEVDVCHLVIALGFGHDAAHSTSNSSAAIAAAPSYSSAKINPANNYARFVALFHLGSAAASGAANLAAGEIFAKPKFLGVLDAEGRTIDENLAAGTAAN